MTAIEKLKEKYKNELDKDLKTTEVDLSSPLKWTEEDEARDQKLGEGLHQGLKDGSIVYRCELKRNTSIGTSTKGINYEDG